MASFRSTLAAVAVATAVAGLTGASSAIAATPAPAWAISSMSTPTDFTPGSGGNIYMVTMRNAGGAVANGVNEPITVTDVLPPGLVATAIIGQGFHGEVSTCTLATLTCTFSEAVAPGEIVTVYIMVSVSSGAKSEELNTATVSGGGAASASTSEQAAISSTPAPFGVQSFAFATPEADGSEARQAGGHPYAATATFFLNTVTADNALEHERHFPAANLKDVKVDLPPGLIGDPAAVPQCELGHLHGCQPDSQVGEATVFETDGGGGNPPFYGVGPKWLRLPIYNVVPEGGAPAEFEFEFRGVTSYIVGGVRSDGDYGVATFSSNATEIVPVWGVSVTFWGVPGEASHDAERGLECRYICGEGGGNTGGGVPFTGFEVKPFLASPTRCGSSLTASLSTDPWQSIGSFVSASFESAALLGCDRLEFKPTLEATPDPYPTRPDSPSGLAVDLHVPQTDTPETLATPDVKDVTVTLPQGVTVSPSSADGLVGCAAEGAHGINLGSGKLTASGQDLTDFEATEPELGGAGFYRPAGGHCPAESQLGEVEVESPLLPGKPLTGHVYLAEPQCDPCTAADARDGKMIGLYLEASGSGVIVKLPGKVKIDPQTGQLTSTFESTPQLPFSELRVKFKSGPRAPLATPALCGSYTTTSDLTPWSTPETLDATPSSPFTIGGCPATMAFAPGFTAGTALPVAGGFTPFSMTLSRNDGEQDLAGVSLTMPPGVAGMLSKVPLCGEAQANAGTCAESSRIGTATVQAGPGSLPLTLSGRVYLTGPYKGAPFGLSIVVPAKAGPFNLGEEVVRAAVSVDPHTAQVSVTSDPLPQSRDGIPFRLKAINVNVDRSGFTFNPTDCSQLHVTGSVSGDLPSGAAGSNMAVSTPFAVTGCKNLPFKPGFSVLTHATHTRAGGEYLHVAVTSGAGQANIAKVRVELPKQLPSRLSTLKLACPEAQFAANPAGCPSGSFVGTATAHTPVLPVPLSGPAIFVSHGGAAFPDLDIVLQGDGVTVILTGNTFISKAGITSSTFASVPDVPVSRFDLILPAGPHSALTGNGDLCSRTATRTRRVKVHAHGRTVYRKRKVHNKVAVKLTMPTTITGQNGAVVRRDTKIAVEGCAKPKARRARRAPGGARASRKARRR